MPDPSTGRCLVAVSGLIDASRRTQAAEGVRPRADYFELERALDAELIDHAAARRDGGTIGRLIERCAGANVLLAWVCFRKRRDYVAILTDGEQVGLPYAVLCRLARRRTLPRHCMIVHILSVRKKSLLFKGLRLGGRIDRLFVYASRQRDFAVNQLHVPPDRVHLTSFMVDTRFFSPSRIVASPRRMICTAGLEFRDYETLVSAVEGLDVEVVIAAASPWSRRSSAVSGSTMPGNVTVCKLDLAELRQLYADALFVVMPLRDVEFQAGITAILEAMSMARAVVCTRTAGQTDTVVDGVTGVYVPPEDPAALRAAIVGLLDDPATAETLGQAGRQWVLDHAELSIYAERLAASVRGT